MNLDLLNLGWPEACELRRPREFLPVVLSCTFMEARTPSRADVEGEGSGTRQTGDGLDQTTKSKHS